MRGFFGQKITLVAQFGAPYGSLATVGYKLVNGDGSTFQARTTTGVSELVAGSGIYTVEIGTGVFGAAFEGSVLWDTGGGSPKYASEDLQMVAAPPVGTDYTAGRAAKLDNADVATSTRASQASLDVVDDFVDTEVAAIKAKTDLIPAAGPADAAVWTPTVAGRIDVATSTRSSHTAADVWAVGTRSLTTFGTLVADIWANATRSLTDKAGFSLSAGGVQAIWDALTSALTTVGSIGKRLADNVDATTSSRASQATADAGFAAIPAAVWGSTTRTLTSLGTVVADTAAAVWASVARTLTSFGTLVDQIGDEVWDEASVDHLVTGSTGAALRRLGTGVAVVSSPVAVGGKVSITQGNDYALADNRELRWTLDGSVDITGLDRKVYLVVDGQLIDEATVVSDTDVYVELTAAQTLDLPARSKTYVLQLVIDAATDRTIDLARDVFSVRERLAA